MRRYTERGGSSYFEADHGPPPYVERIRQPGLSRRQATGGKLSYDAQKIRDTEVISQPLYENRVRSPRRISHVRRRRSRARRASYSDDSSHEEAIRRRRMRGRHEGMSDEPTHYMDVEPIMPVRSRSRRSEPSRSLSVAGVVEIDVRIPPGGSQIRYSDSSTSESLSISSQQFSQVGEKTTGPNSAAKPTLAAQKSGLPEENGFSDHIVTSNYPGLPRDTVELRAQLTRLEGKPGRVPGSFTWEHIEDRQPTFENFQSRGVNSIQLNQSERHDVERFLRIVRKNFEQEVTIHDRFSASKNRASSKTDAQGLKARYIRPGFHEQAADVNRKGSLPITWICMPYFALAPYFERSSSSPLPSFCPDLTLLQSRYGKTSRKRDLEQAAAALLKQEKCTIVSQMWCLIVADKLLLTCVPALQKRTSLHDCGVLLVSPSNPSIKSQRPDFLSVSYRRLTTWHFPLEHCRTWVSLASHFRREADRNDLFWTRMRFQDGEKTIHPHMWRSYLDDNKGRVSSLSLVDRVPEFTPASLEKPLDWCRSYVSPMTSFYDKVAQTLGASKDSLDPGASRFTIFDWLSYEESSTPAATKTSPSTISPWCQELLSNCHASLAKHALSKSARAKYQSCATSSYQSVQQRVSFKCTKLLQISDVIDHSASSADEIDDEEALSIIREFWKEFPPASNLDTMEQRDDRQRSYPSRSKEPASDISSVGPGSMKTGVRKDMLRSGIELAAEIVKDITELFICAKVICHFFIDPNADVLVVRKFWGAVDARIDATLRQHDPNPIGLSPHIVKSFMMTTWVLASAKDHILGKFKCPDEFVKLWVAVLSLFIGFCHEKVSELVLLPVWDEWLSKAMNSLVESMTTPIDLREREVVKPQSIVALLCRRLSEDLTLDDPDIARIYEDYFNALDDKVDQQAYDRSHQQTIHKLEQEVDVITDILSLQHNVLEQFQGTLTNKTIWEEEWLHERAIALVDHAKLFIDGRRGRFETLKVNCSDLAQRNLISIETNKDRQEAAILIFTVFTVIFLPSTFVAQFLAIVPLNYQDVGSMQWLFWAIAMPLTVILLLLVLTWAEELKNVSTSLFNFVFRGRGLLKEETLAKSSSSHVRRYVPMGEAEHEVDVHIPDPYSVRRRPTYARRRAYD